MLGGILTLKKLNKLDLKTISFGITYLLFVAYSIILLLLYLFSFSSYEGPRLASIDRYILTYILGVVIFLGGTLLTISAGDKTKKYKIFLIVIAVIVILPNAGRILLDFARVSMNTYPSNTAGAISILSKNIKEKTSENSKIYIIWSGGTTDEGVIFSYYLMPRKNNAQCINIKPPMSVTTENDIWSCTMSIDQLKQKLSGYDYLFLGKTSEEFSNYFTKNLNIEHDANQPILYKIFHENDLRLEVVK